MCNNLFHMYFMTFIYKINVKSYLQLNKAKKMKNEMFQVDDVDANKVISIDKRTR